MTAWLLNVAYQELPNQSIWMSVEGEINHDAVRSEPLRTSPIYLAVDSEKVPVPLSESAKHVCFYFTTNPFKAIATLQNQAPQLLPRLYTSHGLASIIIFFNDLKDVELVTSVIGKSICGYELWNVDNGKIISISTIRPNQNADSDFDLFLTDHRPEDRSLFRDIYNGLRVLKPQFSALSRTHAELASSIVTLSQQLSTNILFLNGLIPERVLESRLNMIFSNDCILVPEILQALIRESSDYERSTIAIHQYRDEAIQVAAIIQSMFQQGIAGNSPILGSSFQAGTFSLLGTGGAFAALLALYSHVRIIFVGFQPERIVAEIFPVMPAPNLCSDPSKYEEWRLNLRSFSLYKTKPQQFGSVQSFFHLLYFSNRLGFRATKLSITAAYQSIMLGMMPSWNLSTIFHEFLHSHVKAILAELLPLSTTDFANAYELYRDRFDNAGKVKFLTPFIQTILLEVVSSLHFVGDPGRRNRHENLDVARCLAMDVLHEDLLRQYDQIDELFVHILDLNYFYQSDATVYIRSIWCSWLTLPFITKRVREYALRTICTIASVDDGRQIDRFQRALTALTSQIESLNKFDFIDHNLGSDYLAVVLCRMARL